MDWWFWFAIGIWGFVLLCFVALAVAFYVWGSRWL